MSQPAEPVEQQTDPQESPPLTPVEMPAPDALMGSRMGDDSPTYDASAIQVLEGLEAVRKVTVLGPSAPSWKRGALRIKGRGPRDTYG